jgi:hypothetical protein
LSVCRAANNVEILTRRIVREGVGWFTYDIVGAVCHLMFVNWRNLLSHCGWWNLSPDDALTWFR